MSNDESGVESPMRRAILKLLAGLGVTSPVLGRAVTALAEESPAVTPALIERAEWVSGLTLDDEKRSLMANGVQRIVDQFRRNRMVPLANDVFPAITFDPFVARASDRTPGARIEPAARVVPGARGHDGRPGSEADVAFAGISELAAWLRAGEVSSRELVELALRRLDAHDGTLRCVIDRRDREALAEADAADAARARGEAASLLHGVPWGAKDLLSWPGTRTTWGATPYRDQRLSTRATVGRRLEEAGAILAAKLTVGALAWGDVWYGGTTKNPWNPDEGSSGSSAGPAAATAAGLLPFTIGTETWGSILSPSTVCGCTGLRPSYGRVSRHGCMALSWSMDKIGPIARSAEDCALVFAAIHGGDGLDPTVRDVPFPWSDSRRRPKDFRIGVLRADFEFDRSSYAAGDDEAEEQLSAARWNEWAEIDRGTLRELEDLGFSLVDVELPSPEEVPCADLGFILTAEAATAFDDLTRSGRDAELVRQVEQAWPNVFRQGQMIPAVEYLRANRLRTRLMREFERRLATVDVLVSPTWVGNLLLMTNLTGHPQICLPNGFASDGTPTSIAFTGKLDGEVDLLEVATLWQNATGYHRRRPPQFV